MKRVLITFAERPTADYPLAVVVLDDTPGCRVPRSQDYQVRSVRDGRIFANGMCSGASWALNSVADFDERRKLHNEWPVNPELDPRLKDVD